MRAARTDENKQGQGFGETWWKHMLAGGLSGGTSRTITAPVDRIKVIAQVSGKPYKMLPGIRSMIKNDGFWSLWRGNGINLAKICPEYASKFATYEVSKVKLLEWEGRPLHAGDRFLAAALAGIVSQTIIYPIEVMKTRFAAVRGLSRPTLRVMTAQLLDKVGYHGFCRGYLSAMGGIILYAGIDLCVYETMKLFLYDKLNHGHGRVAPHVTIACASAACVVAQIASYPLSMASVAIQASDLPVITARGVIRERYRENGLRGLYRGAAMGYAKALPAVTVTYLVYEYVLFALGTSMTI